MQERSYMKLASHYVTRPTPKVRQSVRLTARGHELLDNTPLFDPIQFRPPTLAEQIKRLNDAGKIARGLMPDDDYADDDYGEHDENVPGEGMSPYELNDIVQRVYAETRKTPKKAEKKPVQTPEPASPPPCEEE